MLNIIRSKRKTITIRVIPSGDVEVKCHKHIPERHIIDLVDKNRVWIETQKQNLQNISKDYLFKGEVIDPTVIKGDPVKWYKKQARDEITKLVTYYCNKLNINYNRIFIKNQKSRWGSCSSAGNLNFSWKIILTPQKIIRYLVIHEVCHLIELNHSKRFWDLVYTLDPDYKIHKKYLQKNGYLLINYLE